MNRNQYPPRVYTNTQASCGKCKQLKPHKDFTKDTQNTKHKGIGYWCKSCANLEAKTRYHKTIKHDPTYREKERDRRMKRKFGISMQERKDMLKSQDSKCAICRVQLSDTGHLTHTDHDHVTGKVRGILCTNCNRGLGHFQDSQNIIEKALTYLNTHSNNVAVAKEEPIR